MCPPSVLGRARSPDHTRSAADCCSLRRTRPAAPRPPVTGPRDHTKEPAGTADAQPRRAGPGAVGPRGRRSTISRVDEFVPHDFDVPPRLETPQFVLEPLGPAHNDQDYDAWPSSVDHIHATPGWEDSSWPREMT